ncbi:hypothetical protein F4805DRAFT_468439 [Annulohypoxylon moriforme]|nr:hypothetical protein F4805DRAFT_468439 [Annulohypoxylon moriforme]
MDASTSFSSSHYFPQRRRVVQACLACSRRKTRCDGAKPKCSWCSTQNLDCVYRDSQQPRIEPNTRILLEPSSPQAEMNLDSLSRPSREDDDLGAHISLSHTANANHVYAWPVVRQLLGESVSAEIPPDATDVFFGPPTTVHTTREVPQSWRLFDGEETLAVSELAVKYRDLIQIYFSEVNIFFPLLSPNQIQEDFEGTVEQELGPNRGRLDIPLARYALILLVLCLSAFVSSGKSRICLGSTEARVLRDTSHNQDYHIWESHMEEKLWGKAMILLGLATTDCTIQAGQCTMLASLYTGAKGRVSESFHWAHATAVICETLARRVMINQSSIDDFSDEFRRLYWVAFIYEGNFVSEVSITLPSGIARYEDVVPYPMVDTSNAAQEESSPGIPSSDSQLNELVAFQISTNAAIRRFLNRVNNFVYDSKEQYRVTRADYATWLLRVTADLWSHHSAVYHNLPDFLLTSTRDQGESMSDANPSTPGFIRASNLGNDPWNVLRLKGRYYAGQYIIHRPFIEYVLLDLVNIDTHPSKVAILEKCRMCLEGCRGFINVFDVDVANSVTCLFASGMVTFTMVMILRVCTRCKIFAGILPDNVDEVIYLGKRNLRRFSINIREFEWHLNILEKLEGT